MRFQRFGALLGLAGMLMVAGCQSGQVRQADEPSRQLAYDPAMGGEILIHNGIVYQTVGEPMESDMNDLQAVGTAEGYVLYQLPGGGAGEGGRNLIFIRTVDGRFQALQAIGTAPMERPTQQTMPEGSQEDLPQHQHNP